MSKIEEIYKQAEAGSAAAQYELAGYFGEMSRKFHDHEKVDYCLDQVLIWLEKSADQGYEPAIEALSSIRKKFEIETPKSAEPNQTEEDVGTDDFELEADEENDAKEDAQFDTTPLPDLPLKAVEPEYQVPVQHVREDVPRQPRAWVPDAEEEAFFKSAGVSADLEDTKRYIPRGAAAKQPKKRKKESRMILMVAGVLCVALLIFGIVQVAKLFANSSRPGEVDTDDSGEISGDTNEDEQPTGDDSADLENSGETSGDSDLPEDGTDPQPQAPTYDLSDCDYLTIKPQTFFLESEIVTYRVNSSDGLRMRAGPGTEYDTLATIANGTALEALAKDGNWIFVQYSNQYGWMLTDYMTVAD